MMEGATLGSWQQDNTKESKDYTVEGAPWPEKDNKCASKYVEPTSNKGEIP